jgi:transcriptional adapter 2-alpha
MIDINMSFKNLENPKKKVYCHICERDISKHTYLFCEDCGDIEICVPCFANGKETPRHKRIHRYRVFSRLDFPIYEETWTAIDELLLIEAIETYGYGNWDDIKNHIGGKTKDDVERHFHEFYYAEFNTWRSGDSPTMKLISSPINAIVNSKHLNNLHENRLQIKKGFKNLLDRKLDSLQDVIKEAEEVVQRQGINPNDKSAIYGEILGYMPLREEFDVEYDNDAELFLAEMEFNPEDTEEETKIKYCILEIYNRRLKEREKRKRFVIERGLLNLKEQFAKEKKMSEEEREIRNFLKPFMRFQSIEEHEELVARLLKDLEIKRTIEQLMAADQVGCENLADLENLVFSNENTLKLEKKILEFNNKKTRPKSINVTDRRSARASGIFEGKDGFAGANDMITKNDDSNYNLCYNEIALCEKMGISFNDYLIIKEYLVRECIKRGFIDKAETKQSLAIQQQDYNQIFDFLVENNIILQKNS